MTPLRHPLLRRVLAGLLLSGFASWMLPPTVRASVLTASAPEPWLRHGMGGTETQELPHLDAHQRHRLAQAVAGVLSLQGALSATGGPVLTAGPNKDTPRAGAFGSFAFRHPSLPHLDAARRSASPPGSSALLRTLSSARPLGP